MSMHKRTVADWQGEVDGILMNIRDNYIKLGEVMFMARQELTAAEYTELMEYIRKWGHKESEIRAATAAFLYKNPKLGKEDDLRIAPELLFAGAKNSKILFMDADDQQRLISGEKFQTLMSNGKADKPKPWSELSEPQRNTLIGKGGKILSLAEQRRTLGGKNATNVELGSLELKNLEVRSRSKDGLYQMDASLTEYAKMILAEDGMWDALKEAVEDAHQELGRKEEASVATARRLAHR